MRRNANLKYGCAIAISRAPYLSNQVGTLTICIWAVWLLLSMDRITS